MSNDNQFVCLGGLIGFFAGMIVCALISTYQRDCAIEAGVAHYTVDHKTGRTKFEYIPPVKLLQVPECVSP